MEKSTQKKKIVLGIGIILLLLITIGVSYAYWQFITKQTTLNNVDSSCLSISLTDITEGIKLEKAYPISDEEGMKTSPYTFTITNTCNTFLSYEVILGVTEETTMNSSYMACTRLQSNQNFNRIHKNRSRWLQRSIHFTNRKLISK